MRGFNNHECFSFCFVFCWIEPINCLKCPPPLSSSPTAHTHTTHTNEEIHVKLKQPAIKHAASRGGVTQALSEKCCQVQILWHCCRESISRKEKHLRSSSSSKVSPTLVMNMNYSFRCPPERMTESLIEEMLHKQPESCSIHSSFPINQAFIHPTLEWPRRLRAPYVFVHPRKIRTLAGWTAEEGSKAGKA